MTLPSRLLPGLICAALGAAPVALRGQTDSTPPPSPSATSTGRVVHATERVRRDRSRITLEELETETPGSLYEIVSRLRPRWLTDRFVLAPPVIVVVDGIERGGVEELRGIHSADVALIEYLDQFAIRGRLGKHDHPNGAIMVTTRKI